MPRKRLLIFICGAIGILLIFLWLLNAILQLTYRLEYLVSRLLPFIPYNLIPLILILITGLLITIFVSNISWLTFIAACFYGFKNFTFYQTLLGIVVSIILVHLAFARLSLYVNSKFSDKRYLIMIKTAIEYLIITIFAYYIFF